MPTYDYECKKCGHEFERFQSMSEPPLQRCPQCRGSVQRLIGAGAGILFKGTGFYETDYKKKSEPATEKAASAKGAESSAASKESKPSAEPARKKDKAAAGAAS